MAWGYWTAHSLSARTSRPRSLSPAPGSVVRSRDHSLDRPSIETECGGHPNHVSYHDHSDHHHDHSDHDHHRDSSEWSERNEDRNEDRNHRTKVRDRDRNTLPRVKMELDYVDGRGGGGGGTVMVEQRHTLPRGRTEPESQGWPESAGLPQSQGKASSEGEGWCPGCPVSNVSSCRVSFHSVKDSSSGGGGTGTSSDHDPADREILSSSLPTPPPPPAQKLCNCGGAIPNPSGDPVSSSPHPHHVHHHNHHHHQHHQHHGGQSKEEKHKEVRHVRRSVSARQMEERDLQTEATQSRKHGSMRDSGSSRESHKSSVSQRSSQEDAIESLRMAETPEDQHVRHSGSLKQKYCHIRTPSDVEKTSCKPSEVVRPTQGILLSRTNCEGNISRTQKTSVATSTTATTTATSDINSEERPTSKSVVCAAVCKHELASSPEEKEGRGLGVAAYPTMSQLEKIIAKESAEFKAKYESKQSEKIETIKRRQEVVREMGRASVWAELKGRTSSCGDSALSPAYRSVRSLTPEEADDSTSFHESFEKELLRRRRTRRRSASCSSRCCESEGCCRLDSGQSRSTQSVTGASSRNSSSRSEKSSTRSSRSASIEHIKQGCNSSNCRARTSLR